MIDKSNIKQTKYITTQLSIPGGSAAGMYPSAAAGLDENYDVCDGVAITVQTDGGIANGDFNVQLETAQGIIFDSTPIAVVQVDKNTLVNHRFLDVLFDAKGGKNAKLVGIIAAVPGATMKISITYRLRRLLTPVSIPKV